MAPKIALGFGLLLFLWGCSKDKVALPQDQLAARQEQYLQQAAALYEQLPDMNGCVAGKLKESEKLRAVVFLNQIRRLHGLRDVVYDTTGDAEVMAASLMMAATGVLSHTPDTSWLCYSAAGVRGAGTSNLAGGAKDPNHRFATIEADIVGQLTDVGNLFPDNVGHRRWLLSPFLTKIAYGTVRSRVGNDLTFGAATKVIHPDWSTATGYARDGVIAYPYHEYPARFFAKDALLSFSVLADSTNVWRNQNVSFASASIEVTESGGVPLGISSVSADNQGFGLPNNLQFRAAGLKNGTTYDVRIRNVSVAGQARDYAYWFRLTE